LKTIYYTAYVSTRSTTVLLYAVFLGVVKSPLPAQFAQHLKIREGRQPPRREGCVEVEFCPKCGTLLVPTSSEGKTYLVCRKCGYRKETSSKRGYVVRGEVSGDKREKLLVVEGVRSREKEKVEEEREIMKEYYEVFLESMESEGE